MGQIREGGGGARGGFNFGGGLQFFSGPLTRNFKYIMLHLWNQFGFRFYRPAASRDPAGAQRVWAAACFFV